MTQPLYAGVDAGGTGTRCVVADRRGTILGLGQAGPGNALIGGSEAALASLRKAIEGALGNRSHGAIAHLHVAAAGTIVPPGLRELAVSYSTSDDTAAAFAGALVHGPGLIVIAGTGSASYGETGDGRSALAGGWGPLIGDEGSAYAIGRAALGRLARALDGRMEHSPLVAMLLAHLRVHDRRSLLDRVYDPLMPREEVAALAGLVGRAAEQGDAQAGAILHQAGDDLGSAAGDLAIALGLHDGVLRVATLGGVFRAGSPVLGPFTRRLRGVAPGAEVVPARFPPVVGALILAYRAAGLAVDEALLANLTASWRTYERA